MRLQQAGGSSAGPHVGVRQPLSISSLIERSAGRDEVVGEVVRGMRLSLQLSEHELATRLGTDPVIVRLLEAGELRALPDWDETERVVLGLCRMVAVDPRPILRRIITVTAIPRTGLPPEHRPARIEQTGPRVGVSSGLTPNAAISPPAGPVAAPAHAAHTGNRRRNSRSRSLQRRGRVLMAVAAPMVMIAGIVWSLRSQPPFVHAAISRLPEGMAVRVRGALHSVTDHLAPRRDGMRWIEVADPRTRKADRLPQRAPSPLASPK